MDSPQMTYNVTTHFLVSVAKVGQIPAVETSCYTTFPKMLYSINSDCIYNHHKIFLKSHAVT